MPSKPRCQVIDQENVGIYHVWNRLVQRLHLFGFDLFSGRDLSYRKDWLLNRVRELVSIMAVDVLDFAILDNHLHLVLRNRPDIVKTWSNEEVVRRWWFVCPNRKNEDGTTPDPLPCELKLLMAKVDKYRARLSDISWLMRLACQPIARRANKEDKVDGRFFAKRFDCERLETEAAVLACSLYVDLNWIHAGMALTPEQSKYASAYERIQARWQDTQRKFGRLILAGPYYQTGESTQENNIDADWLAPVFLDERSAAYVGPATVSTADMTERTKQADGTIGPFYNPIGSPRVSNKGFLPITLDQYLKLLDTAGRIVRHGKRGAIPKDLPPILQRLGLKPKQWVNSFMTHFESRSAPQPCPYHRRDFCPSPG